jgi:hypothetical protein
MLPIYTRIERTERLLRMMEQDAPLLAVRVAALTPEHQNSAMSYAELLRRRARLELESLMQERTAAEITETGPQPAD